MTDLAIPPKASPSAHLVLFYRDRAELVSELVSYVDDALRDDANAIVIATRDHRLALLAALGLRQGQPVAQSGRLLILDAEQTLALFMRDGHPDPAQFAHVLGGLLNHYRPEIGELRLYGEMVALLWDQGNTEGALALEDLWTHVLRDKACRLLCAYPLEDTLVGQADGLAQIAQRHTSIHICG